MSSFEEADSSPWRAAEVAEDPWVDLHLALVGYNNHMTDARSPSILFFDKSIATRYSSNSQKIRVMSEAWVNSEIYCPNCSEPQVYSYDNNRPVADFYCTNCREDYELKSKAGSVGDSIVDGAYRTMIERLQSSTNPNFFILSYVAQTLAVTNFCVIPKHFFVSEIIERRKPLALTAKRAGWVGCNILLRSIPESGKIFYIRAGRAQPKGAVRSAWQRTLFLRDETDMSRKRWTIDVMRCIERIGKHDFSLADVYCFEGELSARHPDNHHIREKIRQQLQVLRDKGYLEFDRRGQYRLV